MKLLIDEDLSPQIVRWCAERKGLYAVAVPHVGLSGQDDLAVWRFAFENDFVVVTANTRDFIELLDVELHPGLIVLRDALVRNGMIPTALSNDRHPARM